MIMLSSAVATNPGWRADTRRPFLLSERPLSIELMSRVWKLDLLTQDKFILLAFADHADDSGFCYPSLARVAWKCGLSKDTVRRALARLVVAGLVQIEQKGNGLGHPSQYRLIVDKGSNLQPFTAKGSQLAAQRVATRGAKGSTAMLPESSLEPSLNLNTATEPAAAFCGRILFITEEQDKRLSLVFNGNDLDASYPEADLYMDSHPEKKYKNHYAFMRNWMSRQKNLPPAVADKFESAKVEAQVGSYDGDSRRAQEAYERNKRVWGES